MWHVDDLFFRENGQYLYIGGKSSDSRVDILPSKWVSQGSIFSHFSLNWNNIAKLGNIEEGYCKTWNLKDDFTIFPKVKWHKNISIHEQ